MNEYTNEKGGRAKSRPQEKRNNCTRPNFRTRIVVNCGKLRDVDFKNFPPNCVVHFTDVSDANRFRDFRRYEYSHPIDNTPQ